VIVDLPDVEFTESDALTETTRGAAGFGSSGVA
jgi:dUTPase